MSVKIIKKNILEAQFNEIIVHQTNCLTKNPLGLAKDLFELYPNANCYNSTYNRIPGEIIVINSNNSPIIVNLFGQHKPGKVNRYETSLKREEWFNQGLDNLLEYLIENNLSNKIIFPFKIGCGLAGGKWDNYYKMISDFSEKYNGKVVIYKL